MNKWILAVLVCSTVGLASPGFAQGSAGSKDAAPERVVITREVVVTHSVGREAVAPTEPATLNGGVGGSIGGYYINGATRADNLPLPGKALPLR
jgi:hypothetical protein